MQIQVPASRGEHVTGADLRAKDDGVSRAQRAQIPVALDRDDLLGSGQLRVDDLRVAEVFGQIDCRPNPRAFINS